mmetsp:Transcript_103597/g.200742  ORF Transcript_103597/g.200742 Transcript_103597/m.200742 type:complete len:269 (+) Transcript_103597:99-905(+)
MEPPSKRWRTPGVLHSDGTVVFDVRGVLFKVLSQTISARPSTLLANLLDDIGSDAGRPIFVDANPERFNHILDWYQYGEMFVPTGYPIPAVLRDARFFLLPDTLKINESTFVLRPTSAEQVTAAMTSVVTSSWPKFEQYVEDLIKQVKDCYTSNAESAARPEEEVLWNGEREIRGHTDAGLLCQQQHGRKAAVSRAAACCKTFVLAEAHSYGYMQDHYRWSDSSNVCSQLRLWVLMAELAKRGFKCELPRLLDDRVRLHVSLNLEDAT